MMNARARTPDCYAVLGVAPSATDAEIKRQYRRLMREVHPDANIDDPEATRKAARLNEAFETLGDPMARAAYDLRTRPTGAAIRRHYEHVAEQPDWEDIVAESVPPRRPKHVHSPAPVVEPEEIEVDMAELRQHPRVRRRIRVTNNCDCTISGDVSTSEPWLRGPVGHLTAGPGETIEFDAEIVAAKVAFPGLSRIVFVAKDWTAVIPVKITGYAPKTRRVYPATNASYVPNRRRRAVRPR
jgi:curved DNA-binding protein CbpA